MYDNPVDLTPYRLKTDVALQSDMEQAIPTENTKTVTSLRGWQGFKFWVNNTLFNSLPTISKTLFGSISELYNNKVDKATGERLINAAEITKLSNTTNTNSGDETQETIKTKLGAATTGNDGYLSSADWNTFNSKQNTLGYTPENAANKENTALDTSTTKYPTNRLVKEVTDVRLSLDQSIPQTIAGREIHQDGLQLGTTPTVGSFNNGKIYYDVNNKTISAMIADDVTIQLGQEEHIMCINNTGSTILNGQAVRIIGAVGDTPQIALSQANSETNAQFLGTATQNIPNGSTGLITKTGITHDINTSGFNAGDKIYLSPNVLGGITNIMPTDPTEYVVIVGYALIINATNGSILVRPQTNNRLVDLIDVAVSNPQVDDIIKWNGLKYINSRGASASIGTGIPFFFDSTKVITGGTQSEDLETLLKTPSQLAENIHSIVVNNNTLLLDRFIYNTALGVSSINAGTWTFNMYGYVSSANNVSSLPVTVRTVKAISGSITITGSGTSRTATVTGATPFISGHANSDITLCGLIQTPQGVFRISGFTSSSVVTITTLSTYVNESTVTYLIHELLFTDATTEVNNLSVGLIQSQSIQPTFTLGVTDKLSISIYARTNAAANRTLYFYHGGTQYYSNFVSPLITVHNDIPGTQGGDATDKIHLTAAEYSSVGTIDNKVTKITGDPTKLYTFDSSGNIIDTGYLVEDLDNWVLAT